MKKILLSCLLIISLTAVHAQGAAGFNKFWATFQPLLVSNNYTALQKHVQFPLKSRGVEDGMKILNVSKAGFAVAMTKFLALDSYDNNNRAFPMINNYIKWVQVPKGNDAYVNARTARIGDLEFTYIGKAWLLTLLYDGRTD